MAVVIPTFLWSDIISFKRTLGHRIQIRRNRRLVSSILPLVLVRLTESFVAVTFEKLHTDHSPPTYVLENDQFRMDNTSALYDLNYFILSCRFRFYCAQMTVMPRLAQACIFPFLHRSLRLRTGFITFVRLTTMLCLARATSLISISLTRNESLLFIGDILYRA